MVMFVTLLFVLKLFDFLLIFYNFCIFTLNFLKFDEREGE